MTPYEFPVLFSPASDGGWVISCRALPEAVSQAEPNEDKIEVASGCIQAALECRMEDGEFIPTPDFAYMNEVLVAPPEETVKKLNARAS